MMIKLPIRQGIPQELCKCIAKDAWGHKEKCKPGI